MNLVAYLLIPGILAAGPAARVRSPQESMARELFANFVVGHFVEASRDFNAEMRATIPPALMADVKREIEEKLGAFRGVNDVRQVNEDGLKAIHLIAKYDKGLVDVHVVFDLMNQIGMVTLNPVPEVDPALEAIGRELMANFIAGRFELVGKDFDHTMHSQLPPPALAALAATLTQSYGAFHAVTDVHQVSEKNYRVLELTTPCDKSTLVMRVFFDASGKVAGMKLGPPRP